MAFEYANLNGVQFVHRCLTLSFFVGLIEISLGVLNLGTLVIYITLHILQFTSPLGFLLNYISQPVIKAFSSAVAIQVSTSQVKGLLGLGKVSLNNAIWYQNGFNYDDFLQWKEGRGFVNTWKTVFTHFIHIEPCDAALGFTCIGILLFLRVILT